MKKVLTVAAIALMMAGSTAFACSGCGCSAKKSDKAKTECKACEKGKECKACDAKEKGAEKKCCGTCKKDKEA